MALTRRSVLKRALVGGGLLVFGKLPQPNPLPATSIVRVTSLRTAVPSAARYIGLDEQIALLEPDVGPLMDLLEAGKIRAVTAQRVEWLEDELVPRYSAAHNRGFGVYKLPPSNSQYFMPQDIIRDEHSGENYHVERVDHDHGLLYTREVGWTAVSMPVIDPRPEAEEVAKHVDFGEIGNDELDHAAQDYPYRINSSGMRPAREWADEYDFKDSRWGNDDAKAYHESRTRGINRLHRQEISSSSRKLKRRHGLDP